MANPEFMPKSELSYWEGAPFENVLNIESLPKFQQRLSEFNSQHGTVLPVEVNHAAKGARPEFPMRYSFHRISHDGTILLLGRDLRPIAEMQQQLVAAQIALEKDYEKQREFDTRFRVLMSSTNEIIMFVSAPTGAISDCNAVAASFFGKPQSELVGSAFVKLFESSIADPIRALVDAGAANISDTVTMQARKSKREMEISPTLFRSGGEQVLLCRITPADGLAMQPDELSDNLARLYQRGVDGMVFVNEAGGILSANEAFQNLTDVTHAQSIPGRSMADFLSRRSVDLNVLLENTSRSGSMRLYATRLVSEHGTERAVEISSTKLSAGSEPVFALIVRDASGVDALRTPSPQVTDVDMRSVIELIGSQNLKEIVAKTTDVVEKMCIETAVELTSNNRVAAAEMLGLSRQSLYVKLRKYDLL
jgi:transcriptional regulator PpsR